MMTQRLRGWVGIPSLVFVRHAMPHVDAAVPAREWPLAADGVEAARRIRLPISPRTRMVASTEIKAIQTLSVIAQRDAAEVLSAPGFDEVRRDEPVDPGFVDRRAAWIRGEPDSRHAGWESFADVGARMDAAIARRRASSMVIGTHGMALTAWLVGAGFVAPGAAAAEFWLSLRCPDVVEVQHRGPSAPVLTRRG